MIDDFAQQFLSPHATMEMPIEDRLALFYHLTCERFDRTVCHGRDAFGDAVPTEGWQRTVINANAEEVLRQLVRAIPEVPEGKLRYAIRRYGDRYSTAQMEAMMAQIGDSRFMAESPVASRNESGR